jgi:hypothetical protein
MAKKKKPRLRAEKEVRRIARLEIGPPPAGRTIPDKRHRNPKHKKPALDSTEG